MSFSAHAPLAERKSSVSLIGDSAEGSAAAFFFFLVFIFSFKNDSTDSFRSYADLHVTLHPLILMMKNYSIVAAIPVAVLWCRICLPAGRLYFGSAGILILMMVVRLISYGRTVFADPASSSAELLPVGVLIFVYVYANTYIARFGFKTFCERLGTGLLWYSLFFISCHLFLLATGYGFAPGRNRFAGVTAYPNFLGMQVAIFETVIGYYALQSLERKAYLRIAGLAMFFAAGQYLIFLSGSRTGLTMSAVGVFFVIWGRQKHLISTVSVVFSILGLAIFAVSMDTIWTSISNSLSGTPLDRGVEFNTRAVVWGLLLQNVMDHPVWGMGQVYAASASESSYLRGWASFGIFYFVGLCVVIAQMLRQLMASRARTPEGALFLGMGFAMVWGGIFEGYLEDRFSAATIFFILLGSVCGAMTVPMASLRRKPARDAVPRAKTAGQYPSGTLAPNTPHDSDRDSLY